MQSSGEDESKIKNSAKLIKVVRLLSLVNIKIGRL